MEKDEKVHFSFAFMLFNIARINYMRDIFLEPDREISDFSEGDWGLR